MMDALQVDLYQRLQTFELDDPTHEFGFIRHLMKDHGWTRDYTQRAIAEYKKFAFLAVVANHQVVPSDPIDQVWHAHLLLTRSYWEEFCPNILGQTLHHYPAQGGRAERAKFHHLYRQTIASYRHFFGSPPTDIWSPPDRRFGAELTMQRVSLSEYWIIPKRLPRLKVNLRLIQLLSAVLMIAFITVGCATTEQKSAPEQCVGALTSTQIITIFSASVVIGVLLRRIIRRPDQQSQKPQLNVYEMAYLAGGGSRVVDLAITQLVHQGYLHLNVQNRTFAIAKIRPSETTELEQQVMQQVHQTPHLQSLRRMETYNIDALKKHLEQEKLLMTGWAGILGLSFSPFFIILGGMLVGLCMVILGQPSAVVSPTITGFDLAIGVITLCCFIPSRRTRWGDQILNDLQKNHDISDVPQRFALYGYQVLSGGVLDDLRQIFKAVEDEAASAAGTCGGCGGGGC